MTHDEISDVKATQACMRCGLYGNWYTEDFHDGSLKPQDLSSVFTTATTPIIQIRTTTNATKKRT